MKVNLPDDFICPICRNSIKKPEYLHSVFAKDVWAYYAAELVAHYKNYHIHYYNRSCNYMGYRDKNPAYTNYEDFNKIVTNRAKRQIIKAAAKNFPTKALLSLLEGFLKLQNNDDKTITLIKKTAMN